MVRKSHFFPALLLHICAGAQVFHTPVGFTYTRLTAYSIQFYDAFSFEANLGALAAKQPFAAGVYGEQRFLLKELGTYSTSVVLPTSSGNFGFQGNYSGSALYNESSLGLAYARSLGSKAAIGIQFNYLSWSAAGYSRASALNVDAGILVHISPQLNAGLQVYNPVSTSWGQKGMNRLATVYTVGIGYDASPQVFFGMEAEIAESRPVGITAGLHYAITDQLFARTGIRSASSLYYLGFGVQMKHFRVDFTATVHPYLGTSPGLLLHYAVKE